MADVLTETDFKCLHRAHHVMDASAVVPSGLSNDVALDGPWPLLHILSPISGLNPRPNDSLPVLVQWCRENSDDEVGASHSKKVPDWARGAPLLDQLRQQVGKDPDLIFKMKNFTCSLDEVLQLQVSGGGRRGPTALTHSKTCSVHTRKF